jgi:putative chitinase
MNRFFPEYGIDTQLRVCGFLGCTGKETDGYLTTQEYGGVAYFTRLYETRRSKAAELGNNQPGDGARFRGRGLMQTTGRYNYTVLNGVIGRSLRIDIVRNPELLREIPLAVQSACFYWQWANLNQFADASEWMKLNGRVNKGDPARRPLHWPERLAYTEAALREIPADFSFATPAVGAGVSGRVQAGLQGAASGRVNVGAARGRGASGGW